MRGGIHPRLNAEVPGLFLGPQYLPRRLTQRMRTQGSGKDKKRNDEKIVTTEMAMALQEAEK